MSKLFFISTALVTVMSSAVFANNKTAPVSGFAQSFISDTAIADATITILETGQTVKTDAKGQFGPIDYPIGKPITLVLEKPGYLTTQSATVIVPKEGLNTPYTNMSFQVPSTYVYHFLRKGIGATIEENACHVAATVIVYHKTMNDVPQGEAGATITLSPNVTFTPFYFDIFKRGPFKDYTYPFATGLTMTSADGGVALFNLPPSEKPYHLSAVKAGVKFTEVQFICRKGAFINLSPPQGPMAKKG